MPVIEKLIFALGPRGVIGLGRVLRRVDRPEPDPDFFPRISYLSHASAPWPLPHAFGIFFIVNARFEMDEFKKILN